VAEVVGFQTTPGTNNKLWVNVDDLKKALDPTVAGSAVAQFIEATKVKSTRAFYANKKMPNPTPVDLATLPPAFKDKIKEANEAFPKEAPMKPDDDDAPAMAKYQADLEAYNKAFDAYRAKIDELVGMKDEFKKYTPVLGAPVLYDPDKVEAVIWEFFPRPPVAQITVEEFLKLPTPVIKDIVSALDEKSKGYQSQIDTLASAKAALEKIVDNSDEAAKGLNQQLAEAQTARTTDVAKLTKESTDATAKLEEARVALTSAQNLLAQTQETAKVEKARDKQNIDALEQRTREDKQRLDFSIARNDPDGRILGADARSVVYVNLGSADHVYAGLKFGVSYIGRGAIRSPKGEITITKVLQDHYSQARISGRVPGEKPMVTGDILANPFFDARKPVKVFLAGPLRKYSKEIAAARLRQMGAIVVDQLDASVDLLLIPDNVAAKLQGADAAPAEGDAAAPAAQESEYDRLVRLAKDFGATIVTERMVEAFFNY
jgi:hypothetical protein